jgi:hypothetical protein
MHGDGRQTALLNWALANSQPRENIEQQPPPQIDRKWMDILLTSETEKMKKALATFLDANTTLDDRKDALDEINEYCERIDSANDLPKINGLNPIIHATTDPSSDIRWRAAFVLGTCAQNNPEFQNKLFESGGIAALLQLLGTNETPEVRSKALFALSGVLRNNSNNCNAFSRMNGFSTLVRSFRGTDVSFRRKLAFILNNLVREVPSIADLLIQKEEALAVLDQLSSDDPDLLFNTVDLLLTLTRSSPRNAKQYKDVGAVEKIQELLTRTQAQPENFSDVIPMSRTLLNIVSK